MDKIVVSGFFDTPHAGHTHFFRMASFYGDVYVALGSDEASLVQKNKLPIYNEDERLFLVKSCRYVRDAFICKQTGPLCFLEILEKIKPRYFIINKDGDTLEKRKFVQDLGIEYIVLNRTPPRGLPKRSSSEIRKLTHKIPTKCAISGFFDQPFIGKICPGPVIVFPVYPEKELEDRSGAATSTRKKIQELYELGLYPNDLDKFIELVFCYENPPGSKYLSGSMDPIGTLLPGIHKLNYSGNHWPDSIESITDEETMRWVENNLWFKQTEPRPPQLGSTIEKAIFNKIALECLTQNVEDAWKSIKEKNLHDLGLAMTYATYNIPHFIPGFAPPNILNKIAKYKKDSYGVFLQGAGGGGYCLMANPTQPQNSISFKLVRPNEI